MKCSISLIDLWKITHILNLQVQWHILYLPRLYGRFTLSAEKIVTCFSAGSDRSCQQRGAVPCAFSTQGTISLFYLNSIHFCAWQLTGLNRDTQSGVENADMLQFFCVIVYSCNCEQGTQKNIVFCMPLWRATLWKTQLSTQVWTNPK